MKRRLYYWTRLLLLSFVLTSISRPVLAQEPEAPPRQSDRTAPARAAVVIQGTDSPDMAQTLLEIPAQADAYIASARPNENFGSAALYVGYHNIGEDRFGAERSLLRFDLGSIPGEATLEEATLRLYMSFATPSDTEAMRIIARQLNSAWDEQFVSWNTEPTWGPVRAETFVGTAEGWYEWDLRELVDEWRSGQTLNHGVELIGDETVQLRERAFNSRETASNLYPRLIVRYSEPTDEQAPVVTVDPLNEVSARNFTVSWSGSDPGGSGIAHYDVQVRVEGGDWNDWQIATSETSAEFTGGESGKLYEFRARGVDNAGNVEEFGDTEASTTVDVRAPTATVNPLPSYLQEVSFTVSWQGDDVGSGIASYDVRYRLNREDWILWQEETTATSAVFNAEEDGLYEFEVRAVDEAGLVGSFDGSDEASILIDANPPFIEPCCLLPFIVSEQ